MVLLWYSTSGPPRCVYYDEELNCSALIPGLGNDFTVIANENQEFYAMCYGLDAGVLADTPPLGTYTIMGAGRGLLVLKRISVTREVDAKGVPVTWIRQQSRLVIPVWVLALTIPALISFRWLYDCVRRSARRRRGHCVDCGYDLRHSPVRCPECGLNVANASQSWLSRVFE